MPGAAPILASAEIGHLTICQVAAEACRHAGMNPFDLPLRNVGVYVGHNLGGPVAGELIYGVMVEETAQYLREIDEFGRMCGDQTDAVIAEVIARVRDQLPRRGPQGDPKSTTHMGAAIISEALGLDGPAMVLDAACSSALQGLAMASRALQLGRVDMAIVGGASYFHVDSLLLFSAAQSGSAKGSCPFDADADGLVSGEGYAAIVVKTLPRALADGDPISPRDPWHRRIIRRPWKEPLGSTQRGPSAGNPTGLPGRRRHWPLAVHRGDMPPPRRSAI